MVVKYKTDTLYVKGKIKMNKTQDDDYNFKDTAENYMKFWIKE